MDWTCTTSGSIQTCTIATSTPSFVTYNDFMFAFAIIIFVLGIIAWGLVFSLFKR